MTESQFNSLHAGQLVLADGMLVEILTIYYQGGKVKLSVLLHIDGAPLIVDGLTFTDFNWVLDSEGWVQNA